MKLQSGSGNGQLSEDVRVPVRILPSRGMHLAKSVLFILVGGLALMGWALAISLHRPVASSELLQASLLFCGLMAVAAFLILRRQLRFFGPRGRYWLVIERDKFAFVTPGRQEIYEWRDLTRFVVEEEVREIMDSRKHIEQSVTIYVTANDTGPQPRTLRIAADDFAAKLPGNGRERAERFCAILNEMRRWATDSTAEHGTLSLRAISGLVLAAA